MISGTSTILSKSGPVDLLIITKMLQRIQEKLWNHPGEILFMSIWDSKKRFFREMYVRGIIFVSICFPFLIFIVEI